ncbi:hypothetical protein QLX67_12380, partial [Balneolaceae bacterium ANBcel3]|nr:hypothetical protein [Balneolaceae bacterium ANBcel3]
MDLRNYFPDSSPQKLVGIAVAASAVLLLLWLFMVSRMEYEPPVVTETPEDVRAQERRESVRVMMGKDEVVPAADERGSRLFMNAVTTFFVMMILLLGVWVWSK